MEYNLRTRRSAASPELSAPSSPSGLPKETTLPSYLSTANAVVVDAICFAPLFKDEASVATANANAALEEFGNAEQTAVEVVPTVEAVDASAARKARVAELKAENKTK